MRISLRVPRIFRTDPEHRRLRARSGVIDIVVRIWAFGVMSGVAIVLHANGADLVTASGAVVAIGAAAGQLTSASAGELRSSTLAAS